MVSRLGTVNIVDRSSGRYHHGDLRAALLAAATDIIATDGLEAFSLRAAARRAGVSATAPAHHFGDARGLLTAVATRGFVALAEVLEGANEGRNGRAGLLAQGRAYVAFAAANPGLFRLMWRKALLDMGDAEHVAAGRRAFDALDRAVRPAGLPAGSPDDPALAPSIACWSLVHGFALLALDGAFARQGEEPRSMDALLDATLEHLDVP